MESNETQLRGYSLNPDIVSYSAPTQLIEAIQPPIDHLPTHVDAEDRRSSAYWSIRSRTMNTGFGAGAPRTEKFEGVREGREKGGFLPRLKGVGRTGKGAVPVPRSMLRALGVGSMESFRTARGLEAVDEDEELDRKVEPGGLESIDLSDWWKEHNVTMEAKGIEEACWVIAVRRNGHSSRKITVSACEDVLRDFNASRNRMRRAFKIIEQLRENQRAIEAIDANLAEKQTRLEIFDETQPGPGREGMESFFLDPRGELLQLSRLGGRREQVDMTRTEAACFEASRNAEEGVNKEACFLGSILEKVAQNIKAVIHEELDIIWDRREYSPAGEKLALNRCDQLRGQLHTIVELWSTGLELANLDHPIQVLELEEKLHEIDQRLCSLSVVMRVDRYDLRDVSGQDDSLMGEPNLMLLSKAVGATM